MQKCVPKCELILLIVVLLGVVLSPTYLKDKHMILPMDLTKTDEHSSLVQRIIQRYDKVSCKNWPNKNQI